MTEDAALKQYIGERTAYRSDISPYEQVALGIFSKEAECLAAHDKNGGSYQEYVADVKNIPDTDLSMTAKALRDVWTAGAESGFGDEKAIRDSRSFKIVAKAVEHRYKRGGIEEMADFAENALMLPLVEAVSAKTMPGVSRDEEFFKAAEKDPYTILALGTKKPEIAASLTSAADMNKACKEQTDYEQAGLPMEEMLSRLEFMAAADSLKAEFKQPGERQGGLIWAAKYVNTNLGFKQQPAKSSEMNAATVSALKSASLFR